MKAAHKHVGKLCLGGAGRCRGDKSYTTLKIDAAATPQCAPLSALVVQTFDCGRKVTIAYEYLHTANPITISAVFEFSQMFLLNWCLSMSMQKVQKNFFRL